MFVVFVPHFHNKRIFKCLTHSSFHESIVQYLSKYPLNEEGVGRIENQMNRYGEGNTRNPRKGGGYDIKGEPKRMVDDHVFVGFRIKILDDEPL